MNAPVHLIRLTKFTRSPYVLHWGHKGFAYMAKTETVRARVEPELKRDAQAVLSELGLSTSEAITLFLRQVTLRRGLPFAVHIPNQETRKAIAEVRDGTDLETYTTVEEWADEMRKL